MAQNKMTLISCMVRLRGSLDNVVPPADRGFGVGVVSWPEALLLMNLHEADDCLEGVQRVGFAQTSARDEKARLAHIYGADAVEKMYPGVVPQMEMEMPKGAEDAANAANAAAASEARAASVPLFVIDNPAAAVAAAPAPAPIAEDEPAAEVDPRALFEEPADPAVDGGAVRSRRRA